MIFGWWVVLFMVFFLSVVLLLGSFVDVDYECIGGWYGLFE